MTKAQQRNQFLLSFFDHPWFNHKCVSIGNWKLLQSYNPKTEAWQVAIYPDSHYRGKVHQNIELRKSAQE